VAIKLQEQLWKPPAMLSEWENPTTRSLLLSGRKRNHRKVWKYPPFSLMLVLVSSIWVYTLDIEGETSRIKVTYMRVANRHDFRWAIQKTSTKKWGKCFSVRSRDIGLLNKQKKVYSICCVVVWLNWSAQGNLCLYGLVSHTHLIVGGYISQHKIASPEHVHATQFTPHVHIQTITLTQGNYWAPTPQTFTYYSLTRPMCLLTDDI
jgi:hypothetical protein